VHITNEIVSILDGLDMEKNMIYTVNAVSLNEIFSENHFCFIDQSNGVIKMQLIGDPFLFETGLLNLEIYDSDLNIWHASFHMCSGFHEAPCYLQIDDKLLIMPSSRGTIYVYSLHERRCIDVFRSHNRHLQTEDGVSLMDWRFLSHKEYLLIRGAYMLSVFDIHGLRWQVDTDASCCCTLDVVGEEIKIIEDHGTYTMWIYELETGRLLKKTHW